MDRETYDKENAARGLPSKPLNKRKYTVSDVAKRDNYAMAQQYYEVLAFLMWMLQIRAPRR